MTNKVMSKYVFNWMKLQKNEQEENQELRLKHSASARSSFGPFSQEFLFFNFQPSRDSVFVAGWWKKKLFKSG